MTELPRDVVQRLYDYIGATATWRDMRLVCKRWLHASYFNQKFWYNWLLEHGKTRVVKLEGHNLFSCPKSCTNSYHYSTIVREPVILKTVPIHQQVLQAVARKQVKKLSRALDGAQKALDATRLALPVLERDFQRLKRDLAVADAIGETHAGVRKKTRIELNISK